ncbi:DUF4317 domain-containing protein [Lachnoclostridium phytofermentans]|uniref:DUF4317 domain-containing protein n=1 Tax=Lachnoclostridium phytofermentans (strain ATCC 700394 / DSM 18823 / ISDg) TaxID=357809 RepID=A9KM09_LACP7|nr:DUF4317 domain-containing protein [Lachnoclostridium phytofermentans]ABX41352.1 conserved hypothetical protein [Lachnoclostridium phytofermentans ISDg]
MTKKDVLELKRRLKKNDCTFSRMCGCYVNAEKEIVLNLEETFLNLKDEEFFKYLEIANKTLSGTLGNNLLELEFPLEEENAGGKQQFLMGLKESKLKNSALLESFYQLIIDNYDYTGNYLILIFHDSYDVMTKTSDNAKLDESEEVYDYLICAVCPVSLSKAGLGYLEIENRIGPRNRDWIVNAPDTGFVFPAFSDRSSDIHSVLYFTKDTKEPHKEFMELVLGCPVKQTATEQKNTFQTIICNAINDEQKSEAVFMEIQETLNQMVDEQSEYKDTKQDQEPLFLTNDSIQDILSASGLPEEVTAKIETSYAENFADMPPVVDHLIDNKILAASAQKRKEQELTEQVIKLQKKLEEVAVTRENGNITDQVDSDNIDTDSSDDSANSNFDVILKVKPQKMQQITSQIIDGKKCIVIPMEDNEQANVNGVTDLL